MIENTKYITLIAVFTLLVSSFLGMLWATTKAIKIAQIIITSYGQDELISFYLIQLVDAFLVAIALYIFAVSIYELFIGGLNLPSFVMAHNFHELKSKLGGVILLVITVKFAEHLVEGKNAQDILYYAIGTAAVAGVLIAFSYFGAKD